ncbi:MAG TPA: hypothetical protein VHM30_16915, partial [Gemmatimonadaceae bacterium]|nr:hypothetical protein [Gemmatimonadaceae bacterium]
ELSRRTTLTPEQRAAELGAVLPPSPHLPDSVRLRQTSWAEYSALGWLFGTARCIELFRGDSGGPYPRSLGELKAWSLRDTTSSYGCASQLTRSTRDPALTFLTPADARVLRYTPPAGAVGPYRTSPFTLEIEAIWDTAQHLRGRPGVRNFLLDSAGNVHFTDEQRRVTMRDPVLPPCDPPEILKAVPECAVSYPARLRWNAFPLPSVSMYMPGSVRQGEELSALLMYSPVYPIDSVVRVTIDWGDNASGVLKEVSSVSERSYGTHHDWNRRISHAYRAPGSYRLEATFTTRNGDTWKASGTVAVTSSGH